MAFEYVYLTPTHPKNNCDIIYLKVCQNQNISIVRIPKQEDIDMKFDLILQIS